MKRQSEESTDDAADDAYPTDADGESTQRLRRPAKKTVAKSTSKRAPAKRASRSSADSDES